MTISANSTPEGEILQGQHESQELKVPLYFPVSIPKLVLMSLCTFGLYELYWFYKNWQIEKQRTKENLHPFWRTLFFFFFCYSLFKRIGEICRSNNARPLYRAGLTAIVYILFNVNMQIGPIRIGYEFGHLFSYLSFLPLIGVQRTVNELNHRVAPQADENTRFSGWNIAIVVIGGFLLIVNIIETLFPGTFWQVEVERTFHVVDRTVEEIARDDRFIAYSNGVVKDTKTGLEWVAGPDRGTTWLEAKSWVQNLTVDGGGWRFPTINELKTLYQQGVGTRNMTPFLKITGWSVWSEQSDSRVAYAFAFGLGFVRRDYLDSKLGSTNCRCFAVRSRKHLLNYLQKSHE